MKIISTRNAFEKFVIKYISWFVLIAYMLVIFFLSSQKDYQSDGLSTAIAEKIRPYAISLNFQHNGEPVSVAYLNCKIRKLTHFAEYFFLAILIFTALSLLHIRCNKKLVSALILSVICAAFDEMHQIFVPGRGPGIRDVFIDSCGAVAAVFFLFLARKTIMRV